jgi:2-polyprenyl-3-methyl-5-hydroxy-6-metoxy-1,4-benzoquinol methylase
MAALNKIQTADFYGEAPRTELLPFIPPGARSWLDVGCGTGATSRAILDAGVSLVHGVEFNPTAAAAARTRLPKVFEVDLERDVSWQPSQRYDVVSFFDVLEHLQDPWTLLHRVQHWLVPGGTLIVSLPNLRYWPVLKDLAFGKRFRYRDRGVTDRTHLRFFCRDDMTELLSQAGYRVRQVEGVNRTTPYWKARIAFALLPGLLDDTRFQQFVLVAALRDQLANRPSMHAQS